MHNAYFEYVTRPYEKDKGCLLVSAASSSQVPAELRKAVQLKRDLRDCYSLPFLPSYHVNVVEL